MRHFVSRLYHLHRIPISTFRIGSQLIFAALLSIAISCNAPRENPLDPSNPDAELGVFSGTVQTLSSPRKGLGDALVIFNGEILAKSNSTGEFTVNYITPSDGWYYFQCVGYATDSMYISWAGKKSLSVTMQLNQIPVLDSLFMYSSVRSGFSTSQTKYELVVRTKISDKDSDIDSVFIQNTALGVSIHLPYNVDDKAFTRSFVASDLNTSDLSELIGTPLTIVVKDLQGRRSAIGSGYLQRILKDIVLGVTPGNLTTESSTPKMIWEDVPITYNYTYHVQVFTADVFPQTLAWERSNIASDVDSCTVDKALAKGTYYWLIWRVDNSHNRISSTPLSFIVE